MYTNKIDNGKELICVQNDIIYISPNRINLIYSKQERNAYDMVAIPLIGIYNISYSQSELKICFDTKKWNGIVSDELVRLPDNSSSIAFTDVIKKSKELNSIEINGLYLGFESRDKDIDKKIYALGNIIANHIGLNNSYVEETIKMSENLKETTHNNSLANKGLFNKKRFSIIKDRIINLLYKNTINNK